jgi:hypothetical protein
METPEENSRIKEKGAEQMEDNSVAFEGFSYKTSATE